MQKTLKSKEKLLVKQGKTIKIPWALGDLGPWALGTLGPSGTHAPLEPGPLGTRLPLARGDPPQVLFISFSMLFISFS